MPEPSPQTETPARRPRFVTRLMHLAFLASRPLTMGARVAAFDAQGRILLVKHTYVPGWHFPGGGVEAGETVGQAAQRELREEANVETGGPMILHGVYFNARASRRDHVVVFVARGARQTAPKAADREILAAEFFAVGALPDGVNRAVTERLAEIAGLAETSPFW